MKDLWNSLNMYERNEYIKAAVANGLRDPKEIREAYNSFAEGGPFDYNTLSNDTEYNVWLKNLADAWGTTVEDLSREQNYDYKKYFYSNRADAYNQLDNIKKGINSHFPDTGYIGSYKTPNHPTYLDSTSYWNNNEDAFFPSERQMMMDNPYNSKESNTDRILDYLGSDSQYNNGGTQVVYQGGVVLPTAYVTPHETYFLLQRNANNTGYVYKPDEYANGGGLDFLDKPFSYKPIPKVRY